MISQSLLTLNNTQHGLSAEPIRYRVAGSVRQLCSRTGFYVVVTAVRTAAVQGLRMRTKCSTVLCQYCQYSIFTKQAVRFHMWILQSACMHIG